MDRMLRYPQDDVNAIVAISQLCETRNTPPMDIVEWIRGGLRKPGKTQAGLAAALNVDPAAVSRLLKGDRKLRADELPKVARYLESDPAAISVPAEKSSARKEYDGLTPFAPVQLPEPSSLRYGLPIYGVGACHGEYFGGTFEFNGEVVSRTRFPPALNDVPGAYGIYASGDSMEPRFEHGDLVYVHPTRPPKPGDDVVVQLHPDNVADVVAMVMIKRLVRRTAHKIILKQFNPQKEIEVPVERVKALHKILMGEELF
jgi:phage repressor protein C with HTH and peptisase S24 domain